MYMTDVCVYMTDVCLYMMDLFGIYFPNFVSLSFRSVFRNLGSILFRHFENEEILLSCIAARGWHGR